MSKTAEQKALEAYPIKHIILPFCFSIPDLNESYRKPYQEGYNQAMQDFLEKAERFIEDTQIENFICRDDGIYFDNERFIEQFKNHMQNE